MNKNELLTIIVLLFCLLLIIFSNIITKEVKADEINNQITLKVINVAIEHSQDVLSIFGGSFGGTKDVWDQNINYSWIVNNTQYEIRTRETNVKTLEDFSELQQYDVFVSAGIQDEHFWLGSPLLDRGLAYISMD